MFAPNSRYARADHYSVQTRDGRTVVAVRLPIRAPMAVRSLHPRLETQRLDLIAAHYLGDATAFWRLCDAADTIAPDALAVRTEIPIPAKDR